MGNRTRNLLLFIVLAGAALGTWMLSRDAEPSAGTRSAGTASSGSFFLDGAVLYATDNDGLIPYTVEAERIEQERDSDQLEFRQLSVRYAPETGVNWEISAARGVASGNLRHLHLTDNIRLTYLGDDVENQDRVFESDELFLYADERRVFTDAEVSMRQGSRTMSGAGLSLNLETLDWQCCQPGGVQDAN